MKDRKILKDALAFSYYYFHAIGPTPSRHLSFPFSMSLTPLFTVKFLLRTYNFRNATYLNYEWVKVKDKVGHFIINDAWFFFIPQICFLL